MRLAPIALAAAMLLPPAAAGAAPERKTPVETGSLARPDWGKVTGWVVDAATRKPVPHAQASVELDGEFPTHGRGTAATDATGRFEARAPLGKISSNLDLWRLATLHP